ncbi:amidase family protein [Pseudomonas chlororaphis]|uniref:Indole acetimide hydrolase n=1 Tax=Pseudomonas chlororaphis TaxID=587753 RepID=A0A1Q8EU78_9PSED|nr:amidase family protein [Pseudomonas chlororaphis]OLF55339.1 indole acetimide hydrolase [Pseudomonas chlororaphis]
MYNQLSIEALVDGFRRGSLCLDSWHRALLEHYADAAHLNSFISFAAPAFSGDTGTPQQRQAPLYGIPVSFKDNINVHGLPTTAGTPGLADYYPAADAGIVQRFKALGARIAGKNNMHELSFGVTSANLSHGAVVNPRHLQHSAGGSSGGCAAAVAAGLVPCAVGTDTGGSVRIPAAFCGVVGFRPSTGVYPGDGIVPVSQTKDSPGLLTRSLDDALFVHRQLTGASQAPIPERNPLRIGIPRQFFWAELDTQVHRDCRAAIDALADQGMDIVPVDDAVIGEVNESIQFPLPIFEFFIDFPRFLLKAGQGERFLDILGSIRDPQIKKTLMTQLESPAISYEDYLQALMSKLRLDREYAGLFRQHRLDLIAYPTVSCTAPLLRDCDAQEHFERFVRNTDPASNLAAPSVSVPVAAPGSLPVGLSFDALPGQDHALLLMAQRLGRLLAPR